MGQAHCQWKEGFCQPRLLVSSKDSGEGSGGGWRLISVLPRTRSGPLSALFFNKTCLLFHPNIYSTPTKKNTGRSFFQLFTVVSARYTGKDNKPCLSTALVCRLVIMRQGCLVIMRQGMPAILCHPAPATCWTQTLS